MENYEKDIEESIKIILETEKGEDAMRPDFGCGIRKLAFENLDSETLNDYKLMICESLTKWEPRINVKSISISLIDEKKVRVSVSYIILKTNNLMEFVNEYFLNNST